jgi:hypothetical protein
MLDRQGRPIGVTTLLLGGEPVDQAIRWTILAGFRVALRLLSPLAR